jgi:hypothetical protein
LKVVNKQRENVRKHIWNINCILFLRRSSGGGDTNQMKQIRHQSEIFIYSTITAFLSFIEVDLNLTPKQISMLINGLKYVIPCQSQFGRKSSVDDSIDKQYQSIWSLVWSSEQIYLSKPSEESLSQDEIMITVAWLSPPTFAEGGGFTKYLWEWATKYNDSNCILTEQNAPRIIKLAADGAIKEAELMGKKEPNKKANHIYYGKQIAEKFLKVKDSSLTEISKQCIFCYTIECFFYRLVNSVLREEDFSKLETLGPYCFLLLNSLWNCRERNKYVQRVFRGMTLKPNHIQKCKDAIGKTRCWLGFTSTTKQPNVTKPFKKQSSPDDIVASVIIDIVERLFTESFGLDVVDMSDHPGEEEMLFPAGINFVVDKVFIMNQLRHIRFI